MRWPSCSAPIRGPGTTTEAAVDAHLLPSLFSPRFSPNFRIEAPFSSSRASALLPWLSSSRASPQDLPARIEGHGEVRRVLLSLPAGGIELGTSGQTKSSTPLLPRPPLARTDSVAVGHPLVAPTCSAFPGERCFSLTPSPAPLTLSSPPVWSPSDAGVTAPSEPGLDPGLTGLKAGWLGLMPGLGLGLGRPKGRRPRPPSRPSAQPRPATRPTPSGHPPALGPAWPVWRPAWLQFHFSFLENKTNLNN